MDILEDKTFIELLAIVDEIERTKAETELLMKAKSLGIQPQFKKLLKQWEKRIKNEKMFVNAGNLPPTKYEVQNFNFGSYQVDRDGITDNSNNKFSYLPIVPVERFINEDTNKEKVKIIFYKENKWHELVVDRSQLAMSTKLIQLSDFGLDITSENVKYYVNYFNEIINLNKIKKLSSVSHIGWKEDLFIPFDNDAIFDGEDDFKNIYKSIEQKGDYELWKTTLTDLRAKKSIRMLMATTLASPLLEKMNLQPFIVNAWSSLSGNGKTLSCMLAMSIWGNPDMGALRFSSNNTVNYYITVASFMRNITCYFDELQIIKNNRYFDTESLVMDLCNQTERGRLNKNSQAKEVKTWYNNFLFTSNDKLVKENAGEQVYNRVIDLEIREKIYEDGIAVAQIVKNNYGFAGRDYIKHIQELGFDKIHDKFNIIYNEVLTNTKATDKQASSLATILLADKLITECIFTTDKQLTVEDIVEYVNDKDEIKTSIKSRDKVINMIASNYKKFEDWGYSEIWGKIDGGVCTINYDILSREMKKIGFEFDTVKKEWADEGFLEKSGTNRYVHQTSVHRQKGTFVRLNIDLN